MSWCVKYSQESAEIALHTIMKIEPDADRYVIKPNRGRDYTSYTVAAEYDQKERDIHDHEI